MKSVIMAGGFGTRLRPLTCNVPKPMVPIANKPMMEHVVELLKKNEINDVLSILYYQPGVITNYFGNGENFGIKMSYVFAATDLGTAGSVKNAENLLKENFIVISGDVLTDFNLQKAIAFHRQKKSLATIVLTRVNNPLSFGVVITDKRGKITRFLEKPNWGEVFSDTINTGIYILEPEVLQYIPANKKFDFSKDLFPFLLENKKSLYGYIAEGYWKDIGSLNEYRQAHFDVLKQPALVNISGVKSTNQENWVGEGSLIDSSVKLAGKVIIGKNCQIKANVEIDDSVIGNNVIIDERAVITKSVLWDGVKVGKEVEIKESTVGYGTLLQKKAIVNEGVVIGDECSIGKKSEIKANIKIWPYKIIDDGAILSTSLVWGEKWLKDLFGAYGITGLINVEITPEFAARVGAAYGAFLGEGSYVLTSRDSHRASRMIKRAIISGLMSAGIHVGDLRTSPIPVVRYELGKEREKGGIHVRISPYESQLMDIKFFDYQGIDISTKQERAIEQLFSREDFKRINLSKIGSISLPHQANEYYKEGFLNYIDQECIKKAGFKIILDYAFSSASFIFPSILGKLGCEVVALNAYLDETKISKNKEDFESSLEQVSSIGTTLKADAGFLLDTGAEKVFLIDEKGNIIRNDIAMAIVISLVLKTTGGNVAVPVNVSRVVERISQKYKAKVYRTAMSPKSMIEFAKQNKDEVNCFCDGIGGYIFPQFQPAFDGMFSVAKILELLAADKSSLYKITRTIPPFIVLHRQIACDWDRKGKVMRCLIDENISAKRRVELIDGVKIFFGRNWVLLRPDPDRPLFHIYAETNDRKKTRDLMNTYIRKIEKWQK